VSKSFCAEEESNRVKARYGNLGDAQTKETPESADPETKMDGSEAIHRNHVASATEVQHSEETASAAATSLNKTASERMPFYCALRVRQATHEIWCALPPTPFDDHICIYIFDNLIPSPRPN